jgi:hypothetical protein
MSAAAFCSAFKSSRGGAVLESASTPSSFGFTFLSVCAAALKVESDSGCWPLASLLI